MTVVVGVDFLHEVSNFVVCNARDILSEHEFDVVEGDRASVLLVENTEALFGFFLSTAAGDPPVGDHNLNEGKVDAVALQEFRVALL